MSTAVWPSTLSQVLDADQFAYEFGPTTTSTDTQNGPKKIRKKFTKSFNLMSGKFVMNYSDFTTLETFYNTTINNGVDPFLMNNPLRGMAQSTFKFTAVPKMNHLGGTKCIVMISLEEQPT